MFTIRKATLEDIPLINKLAWEAFPATYKNILTSEQIDYMMDWMYSPENLRKQMTEEGHIYYIAFEECEGAGYVSIQPEGKDLFHLQKIYVIPYYQKHHLGKLLFCQAIEGIKELHPGPCRMELNVNRENPALGFYQHMGMKKVREEDTHIGNGFYMNDYIMGISI
ncbi:MULTISPECIES: GNAT family N-acetyltransferase [Bacteroidaceae]|uniref:GNAT family N-acetyltransferase n=1 Tax=Bacteroidaceae TaxID=815 RepID=UPI000B36F621|nr:MULTISPECIES: GNAT family N-acetyltransferase [Bacteroidaceae]MDM8304915.1 GNAT family N-acetyltransferase [Phocaeicola salanitronis]OUO19071.1 GNAT family N-acetyltransferase [Bacteroides sp. An322]HJC97293.1 GNAT family N-acetyltransferase [Candidatus Phocaeicola merdavium]